MSDFYLGKKLDIFYYFEFGNLRIQRDKKLSSILGSNYTPEYYLSNNKNTSNLHCTKFYKKIQTHIDKDPKFYKLIKINRSEFINLIKDDLPTNKKDKYQYINNIKRRDSEIKYIENLKKFKEKYKSTDSYELLSDPYLWHKCPDCGLRPLINEFDNGRSTACGCGENEYVHPSVRAESIMSIYKRFNNTSKYNKDELKTNWNHWCRTKDHLFIPNGDRW